MNRTLAIGDIAVARIGLGTNRLTNGAQRVAFVREAVAAGIGLVDTAYTYTSGESETTVGQALSPVPEGCVIATKGGWANGRPETIRQQIDESLRRLRLDSIPLYYLHRPDPEVPIEESLGAIQQARDAGKVRNVGISNVTVEQIERARSIVPIAAVQNRYNLGDRTFDAVVDACAAQGIAFVAYYPLQKGDLPTAVVTIAGQRGVTATQVALAWLLRRSPTVLPIPGTLSLDHVRENLAALDIDLTDAELDSLA
ncbi:MAG TPA: aldo/keto reductase [Candidatus Limnocylindria bacterium]|nr:aldo/keto reductase [Candidatus Limnocylindria bacterium]